MKHGLTGYVRHKCRCDVCKAAAAEARKRSRARHLEKRRAESRAYQKANAEARDARVKAWRAANPERAAASDRARSKRYSEKNREALRERNRSWREANPEKADAAVRAWRAANPEKMRALAKARRARMAGAEVLEILDCDWLRLVARHDGRCAYCGDRTELQKDHVVPISRGGRHAIGNILPACRPCNSSKGNRLLVEWGGRAGRPPHPYLLTKRWQASCQRSSA